MALRYSFHDLGAGTAHIVPDDRIGHHERPSIFRFDHAITGIDAQIFNPKKVRLEWIDAARGLGILLVVMGHVERGLVGAGIARDPAWLRFDFALYTFHMPLFMFLAGLNVRESLRKGRMAFVRGKLETVAYPYVLWSFIQGAVLVLASGYTNKGAQWSDLAHIGWHPMSQFWFLYALTAYFLLIAAVGCRAVIIVPIAVASMLASTLCDPGELPQRLCYFLLFFVIGIVSDWIKASRSPPNVLWLILVGALWSLCLQWVPTTGGAPDLTPYALPCAFLGSAFILLLAQRLAGVFKQLFMKLGIWSLSIYVMHILAASGARIAMARMHVDIPVPVYFAVGVVLGIVLPAAVHSLLERLNLLAAFGLGKSKRITPAPRGQHIGN